MQNPTDRKLPLLLLVFENVNAVQAICKKKKTNQTLFENLMFLKFHIIVNTKVRMQFIPLFNHTHIPYLPFIKLKLWHTQPSNVDPTNLSASLAVRLGLNAHKFWNYKQKKQLKNYNEYQC